MADVVANSPVANNLETNTPRAGGYRRNSLVKVTYDGDKKITKFESGAKGVVPAVVEGLFTLKTGKAAMHFASLGVRATSMQNSDVAKRLEGTKDLFNTADGALDIVGFFQHVAKTAMSVAKLFKGGSLKNVFVNLFKTIKYGASGFVLLIEKGIVHVATAGKYIAKQVGNTAKLVLSGMDLFASIKKIGEKKNASSTQGIEKVGAWLGVVASVATIAFVGFGMITSIFALAAPVIIFPVLLSTMILAHVVRGIAATVIKEKQHLAGAQELKESHNLSLQEALLTENPLGSSNDGNPSADLGEAENLMPSEEEGSQSRDASPEAVDPQTPDASPKAVDSQTPEASPEAESSLEGHEV